MSTSMASGSIGEGVLRSAGLRSAATERKGKLGCTLNPLLGYSASVEVVLMFEAVVLLYI